MAHVQHYRLHEASAADIGRIRPAPFTVCRRQAAPLRVVAATRQPQAPARCVQQAGKRALLAIGSAAVVLSSAIGLTMSGLHACAMRHVCIAGLSQRKHSKSVP
jgi:hypothetical protein